MENKLKHLEMLQNVISRMAGNSFLLKGWSVVMVSALFALAASNPKIHFVYLAYFPSIVFWILDGYFLWQERLFRKLYDKVRIASDTDIDFSMNTSSVTNEVSSWIGTMFSKTLLIFHGAIIATIIIVTAIILVIKP